ncbi:MAG: L,D-transpeptidase family protein [Actinomycetota bacterium]|nr:L,D-transpeptidase family protein [Actinomycetota bacterium]
MSPHLFMLAIASLVVLVLAGVVLAQRAGARHPGAGVLVLDKPEVPLETPLPPPSETPPAPPSVALTPSRTKAAPRVAVTKTRAPAFRYDVARVQRRLTELKYYVGAINGRVTAELRSSVMAFQKVNGLPANGTVNAATLARLDNPVLLTPAATAPAVHVEVDLSRQVLMYVRQGKVERILPVSSGNGATYRQKNGGKARALTPVGWYKIQRKISGLREADLGSLYDPMYFYKGWALHGSNSVPAYPASHGCVRLTRWDALWLFARAPVGLDVYLYGGRHTFPAGSSAPGTDTPSGDPDTASTSPSPAPLQSPSSSPSQSPSSSPSASASPSPAPGSSSSSSPSQSRSPSATPSREEDGDDDDDDEGWAPWHFERKRGASRRR